MLETYAELPDLSRDIQSHSSRLQEVDIVIAITYGKNSGCTPCESELTCRQSGYLEMGARISDSISLNQI